MFVPIVEKRREAAVGKHLPGKHNQFDHGHSRIARVADKLGDAGRHVSDLVKIIRSERIGSYYGEGKVAFTDDASEGVISHELGHAIADKVLGNDSEEVKVVVDAVRSLRSFKRSKPSYREVMENPRQGLHYMVPAEIFARAIEQYVTGTSVERPLDKDEFDKKIRPLLDSVLKVKGVGKALFIPIVERRRQVNSLTVGQTLKHLPDRHNQLDHGRGMTVLHGTSIELLNDILKVGLSTSRAGKNYKFSVVVNGKRRERSVYVSQSKENAEHWARNAMFEQEERGLKNASGLVLKIKIPKEFVSRVKLDEFDRASAKVAQQFFGEPPPGSNKSFRLEFDVRPEWIIGAYTVKRAGYGISPFKALKRTVLNVKKSDVDTNFYIAVWDDDSVQEVITSTVGKMEKSFEGHAGRKGKRGGSVPRKVAADAFVVAHGTRHEAFQSIKEEGLRIEHEGKRTERLFKKHDSIYVATNSFIAMYVGAVNAFMNSKKPYVYVIKLGLTDKEKKGLTRDPLAPFSYKLKKDVGKPKFVGVMKYEIKPHVWRRVRNHIAKTKNFVDWKYVHNRMQTWGLTEDTDIFTKILGRGQNIVVKGLTDYYAALTAEEYEEMFGAEEKSDAVGPTEARVPDFEGEYPTPFQPLRVGYRGKKKKIKHLPTRHDQKMHGRLLHATLSDVVSSIDKNGFKSGTYFLKKSAASKGQHVTAALEGFLVDNFIAWKQDRKIDRLDLVVYDVDLIGTETREDPELPDKAVIAKEQISPSNIRGKKSFRLDYDGLFRIVDKFARETYGREPTNRQYVSFINEMKRGEGGYYLARDTIKHALRSGVLDRKIFKSLDENLYVTAVIILGGHEYISQEFSSIIKHLPTRHDQRSHGGNRKPGWPAEKLPGIFGEVKVQEGFGRPAIVEVSELSRESLGEGEVTGGARYAYDTKTGKLYATTWAQSHAGMLHQLGFVGEAQDRFVRFVTNGYEPMFYFDVAQSGVADTKTEKGLDRASKNIYRVMEHLSKIGMPGATPVTLEYLGNKTTQTTLKSFVAQRNLLDAITKATAATASDAQLDAGKKVAERTLKSLVLKHLPTKHDQRTHAHWAAKELALLDSEKAIIVDPKTGKTSEIEGAARQKIEIDPRTNLQGKILVHNHPNGYAPSWDDLEGAARLGLAEMRIVTPAGDEYSFLPPKGNLRFSTALVGRVEQLYGEKKHALLDEMIRVGKHKGAASQRGGFGRLVWSELSKEHPDLFRYAERIKKSDAKTVLADAIAKATAATASDAQLEAGNYKKQHIRFAGMEVSIENKKGSTREGTDKGGKLWSVKMHYDYGYIRRTEGVDGDHVDVYVGPNEDAEYVYVVHQAKPETGEYDEDKCMLGFRSEEEAKAAYLKQYDSPKYLGAMTVVPLSLFKEKVFGDKGEPVVSDAAKKVAEARLKSLVLMHLPTKHDQQTHAGESVSGNEIVGQVEDPDSNGKMYPVYEVEDWQLLPKDRLALLYDLKSGKLYAANRNVLHEDIEEAVGIGARTDPKTVHLTYHPKSERWNESLIVNIFQTGGSVRRDSDVDLNRAYKAIYRVFDSLVEIGAPESLPTVIEGDVNEVKGTLKSLIAKHLEGQHDQSTHGRGGAVEGVPEVAVGASAETKAAFDRASWEAKTVGDRKKEWEALSQEERDAQADASNSIKAEINNRLAFAGERPTTGAPLDAVASRQKQIGDFVAEDAHAKIAKHMQALDGYLTESGVSEDLRRRMLVDAVDTLAVQENESLSRTLGDHGVRHVLGDAEMALQIMDEVPGYDTPQMKAAVTIAAIYHDTGYLTQPSQIFLDGDHPRWSGQNYDANVRGMVNEALGEDAGDYAGYMINTHADTNLDWKDDPVASALRVADNVALFHDEKLPGLFKYAPENVAVLEDLGAKKISLEDAKAQVIANVKSKGLPKPQETALLKAANEMNVTTPKFTLGMMGGKVSGFGWKDNVLDVSLERNAEASRLQNVLDLGQRQFSKFAEAFGVDTKAFKTEDYFEFRMGDTIVLRTFVGGERLKALRDAILAVKHLPNKHDQKDHGHIYSHGTRHEAFVKIKKEGLQPQEDPSKRTIGGAFERGHVYLGKDIEVAKSTGLVNALMYSKKPYVYVLWIGFSNQDAAKLKLETDPDAPNNALRTLRGIGKDKITAATRYTIDPKVWRTVRARMAAHTKQGGSYDWKRVNSWQYTATKRSLENAFTDYLGKEIKLKSETRFCVPVTGEQMEMLGLIDDEVTEKYLVGREQVTSELGVQTLLSKQVAKHHPGGKDHDQEDHAHPGEGGPLGKIATLSAQRHYQRVDTGKTVTVKLKSGKVRRTKVYEYVDSETGQAITDAAELERIRKLVLPPGVGNVKINPDANGHIQAQWRDATGKSQSRYSKAHDQIQAAEKFARLKAFTKKLPQIRAQVLKDLKSDDPATREAAAVVYLVDKAAFRIGNDNPNAKVKAYGASTLLNGHVRVEADGKLVFDFIGKKGVRIRKAVDDPLLTKMVKDRKTSKWSDPLFNTNYGKVNKYFDGVAGKGFLVKDFRTHHATEWALALMDKRKGRPRTIKAFGVWQKDIATKVAVKMGHTASVSLNQYINPLVWDRWRLPEWGAWVPPKLKSQVEDD